MLIIWNWIVKWKPCVYNMQYMSLQIWKSHINSHERICGQSRCFLIRDSCSFLSSAFSSMNTKRTIWSLPVLSIKIPISNGHVKCFKPISTCYSDVGGNDILNLQITSLEVKIVHGCWGHHCSSWQKPVVGRRFVQTSQWNKILIMWRLRTGASFFEGKSGWATHKEGVIENLSLPVSHHLSAGFLLCRVSSSLQDVSWVLAHDILRMLVENLAGFYVCQNHCVDCFDMCLAHNLNPHLPQYNPTHFQQPMMSWLWVTN